MAMKIFGKKFKLPERRIDSDPHTALFWQLSDDKDSQYAIEAEQLIVEHSLLKTIGKFRIEYWIKDGEVGYSMFDTSNADEMIAGMEGPVPSSKPKLIEDIKEYFAHSEALALTNEK
jgi:hypothetical protein